MHRAADAIIHVDRTDRPGPPSVAYYHIVHGLAQLDADRFWQIHRGTIVNVAHVAATTRDLTGRVKVKLKGRTETLVVSRAYAHRFRQR